MLPTPTKQWQFNINQLVGGTGKWERDFPVLLLKLVQSLTGQGRAADAPPWSNPWQVVKASGPGVDPAKGWTSVDQLLYGKDTSPRSWIVLKQPGILPASDTGQGFQLLISCDQFSYNTNPDGLFISISPSGRFTFPTDKPRPSAPDEIILYSYNNGGGQWPLYASTDPIPFRLHVLQSTDGAVTRVFIHWGNKCIVYWDLSRINPAAPPQAWGTPFIALIRNAANGYGQCDKDLSKVPTPGEGTAKSLIKGKVADLIYTGEAWGGEPGWERIKRASDIDLSWPMFPVGLASETTGAYGRCGSCYDLWWGSSAVSEGSWYPNDGRYQFVQFGNLIMKWDGTPDRAGTMPLIG